jgi:hypothetical protein
MEQFYVTGAIKDKKDNRDYKIEDLLGSPTLEVVELPKDFEVSPITWVKNQLQQPSCVGQATTASKEPEEGVKLSARSLYARCKQMDGNYDWGTSFRQAQEAMIKYGACEEEYFPEPKQALEITTYANTKLMNDFVVANAELHANESYYSIGKKWNGTEYNYFYDVMQAMYTYKSRVVTGCDWYTGYNNLSDTQYALHEPTGNLAGGHAFYINGWRTHNGELQLILVNSWGSAWGDGGKFYANKEWFNKHAYFSWINIDLQKKLPVDKRYYPMENKFYKEEDTGWRPYNKYLEEKAMLAYWTIKLGHMPSERELRGAIYGMWDKEALWGGRVGDAWLYVQKPTWDKWVIEGVQEQYLEKVKRLYKNPSWDGKI